MENKPETSSEKKEIIYHFGWRKGKIRLGSPNAQQDPDFENQRLTVKLRTFAIAMGASIKQIPWRQITSKQVWITFMERVLLRPLPGPARDVGFVLLTALPAILFIMTLALVYLLVNV
jgi:hypothetical protein